MLPFAWPDHHLPPSLPVLVSGSPSGAPPHALFTSFSPSNFASPPATLCSSARTTGFSSIYSPLGLLHCTQASTCTPTSHHKPQLAQVQLYGSPPFPLPFTRNIILSLSRTSSSVRATSLHQLVNPSNPSLTQYSHFQSIHSRTQPRANNPSA